MLAAMVISGMLAVSLAKVTQVAFSGTAGNAAALQAQQYAASQAELVKKTAYSDLADRPRNTIAGTDFQQEIIVSAESDYTDDVKQKEVTVRIYKEAERIPRASLRVLRYSVEKTDSGVPVGTIIAWASSKNPTSGTWLECNGQSCAAYPELAAVLGKDSVPDYRGVFLRGLGSTTFSQINGTNNGVTSTIYGSGHLGTIQGDATRRVDSVLSISGPDFINACGGAIKRTYKNYTYKDRNLGFFIFKCGSSDEFGIENAYVGDFVVSGYHWSNWLDVPVDNEIRPVNIAVRYFIKAA